MREDIKRRIEQIRRGEVPAGYTRTKEGVLPLEWKEKRLGQLADVIMGQSPSSKYYNTNKKGKPLIQGNNDRTDRESDPKVWTTQITKECKTGDILLSVRAPVGTVFRSRHNACIGRGICAIRSAYSDYLFQFLIFHEDRWGKNAQGSTFESINRNEIESKDIPFCERDYLKISEILSTCDRVIELKKKLLEEKIKVKKWFMQTLLTGMIRVKDIENRTPYEELKKRIEQIRSGQVPEGFKRTEAGIVPSDWHEAKMGKLGRFSKGSGISKSDIEREGFPCITYGEIYTDYDYVLKDAHSFVNEHVACKSKRIHKNDLLLTGSGETVEDIGKAVAYVDDEPLYAGGDIIVFTPVGICCSVFLACTLNNGTVSRNKSKLGQGYSVVHIYSDKLKELVVAFPDYDEQIQIAEILSTVDKEIDLLNRDLELWEQKKKSLMQLLLTGIVRTKA